MFFLKNTKTRTFLAFLMQLKQRKHLRRNQQEETATLAQNFGRRKTFRRTKETFPPPERNPSVARRKTFKITIR